MTLNTLRFALVLVLGLLLAPFRTVAAPAGETGMPRLGYLNSHAPERFRVEVFRQTLRELGWVEGQNLVIEYRSAHGQLDRLPALAAELVSLPVNAIVAVPTVAALAARRATRTIPIVFSHVSDPIGSGLVSGLARPGENVTGFTHVNAGLSPKRLELLKESLPGIARAVALLHPGGLGERTESDMLRETEDAARALGLPLQLLVVRGAAELDAAFAAAANGERKVGSTGLIVLPSPLFLTEHRRLVTLAAKHRLPAAYFAREIAEAGGLMAYGANIDDMVRRAAGYVDKVLRGADPGDLPVQQSAKFELVINLKTAKALGLALPPSLLARADELIE